MGEHAKVIENSPEEAAAAQESKPEEIAIEAKNITVSFRSYKERPTTLKENLIRIIKHRKFRYYETFNALSDVSFSLPSGKILGIIGSNGAGKSTLLSVLAGILPPTVGEVNTVGSIDSLRTLGAGFDSELNAIENIYLYGSLHGQKKEYIKSRVTEILQFAELEEFALTPIKYYSSGMYARLGFSVAIDKNPDILIIDEVLAVGDQRFQAKCRKVFEDFMSSGRTVVLVSHSMSFMEKMADVLLVLERGRLVHYGDPKKGVKLYSNKDYQTVLGQ